MLEKERFIKQLEFIHEIDKIKSIIRKTRLFYEDRCENDAEHSWHISLMAVILLEYANESVDLLKVVKMLLIHDIVEIDAGDVMVYEKQETDVDLERQAARRIFGLLPENQAEEYISLWEEFEKRETPEAKYATVLDRLEPVLQNLYRNGDLWRRKDIPVSRVREINYKIRDGSEMIWDYVSKKLDAAVEAGYLKK